MQNSSIRAMARFCGLALLLTLTPLGARAEERQEGSQATRAAMHRVFGALSELLPIALSPERFDDPARQQEIASRLSELTRFAAALDVHARGGDVGFRHLSQSLASDFTDAEQRFALGYAEPARFRLLQATRNCVACHSRLPSTRRFDLPGDLAKQIDQKALSVHEQVQLLLATRQFDAALDTWEELFRDPTLPAGQLELGGYLLDYLTIAIRVRADLPRARAALARLASRADAPADLRRRLATWSEDLASLEREESPENALDRARKVLSPEEPLPEGGRERDPLVVDLAVSGELLRLIDSPERTTAERAEAYFWLGLAESRSIGALWVPMCGAHLEAAIRLAPQAPYAKQAYQLLEDHIRMDFGDLTLNQLPVDIQAKLAELRGLTGTPDPPEAQHSASR